MTGQDLVELLEGQIALADHRIDTAADSFERGLWTGRKHATEEALGYVQKALPEIEAEARLVPEDEEPFASLAERVAA